MRRPIPLVRSLRKVTRQTRPRPKGRAQQSGSPKSTRGSEEYNRAIMTMTLTRRDTLAGAIALFCELGAAEVQARAGVKGEPPLPREEATPESGAATQPELRSEAQSGAASGVQSA